MHVLQAASPREHIAVDVHGHHHLVVGLSPYIQANSRIVMVGSMSGALDHRFSAQRQSQLRSSELTMPMLKQLMDEYVLAAESRETTKAGWPSYGYAVAKAGTIAMARVYSRQPSWNASGVLVNSCCPGYANAPYCQQGAHTIIQLATLPAGNGSSSNGAFFEDPSFTGSIRKRQW